MRQKRIILAAAAALLLSGCSMQPGERTETTSMAFSQPLAAEEPQAPSEPEEISEGVSEDTEAEETETPEEALTAGETETGVFAGLQTEAVIGTLAEATGYDWSDVYIVIMNTILTKPDGHTGTPSFALLPWNDREEPVLIAGYWQDPVSEEYAMYSFSGDTLIEVEHLTGSLSISWEERRILCVKTDGSREMYQYGEDHLVKLTDGAYPSDGFVPLAMTSLTEHTVTVETIRGYIQTDAGQ